MTQRPLIPRPASTLILTRDGARGVEVFLMQRSHQVDFMPGVYVFPGGAVEDADRSNEAALLCRGLDAPAACRHLGLPTDALAYWVAAVRECFEESGFLFAYDAQVRLLGSGETSFTGQLADLRRQVLCGERSLVDLCRAFGLTLAVDQLIYYSHWIAPLGRPRRYDTRFFIAAVPAGQAGSHDNQETIGHLWIRPEDALARRQAGALELATPTFRTLEALTGFADTQALMAQLRARTPGPAITPRLATGRTGEERSLVPEDAAYAEVGKIDPDGSGRAACDIVPGMVVQLSPRVRRITAPNPGVMTGPGTNTYLIDAGGDIAVIDPGPSLEAHLEALLQTAQGRIRWIFVTHTHLDHSPAARQLKERCGAPLIGMPPPAGDRQDVSFQPDIVPHHGQQFKLGDCTLRALHTPGHASNHLCYLLEEEKILFSGDQVMQGSTVVINPPDGDMGAYLASLRALQEEAVDWLAPAHGFLIDRPQEAIARLLAHRLAREDKVFQALHLLGEASVEALVPLAYQDVPPAKHGLAARSLLAHLLKLQQEGRAGEDQGRWRATGQGEPPPIQRP